MPKTGVHCDDPFHYEQGLFTRVHDWVYFSKRNRECIRCGRLEHRFFFYWGVVEGLDHG